MNLDPAICHLPSAICYLLLAQADALAISASPMVQDFAAVAALAIATGMMLYKFHDISAL